MKLLFCEGSSISARESLTALGLSGHEIIICDPNPLCICRFTRFKIKYYKCPLINEDTGKYFNRILEIIRKENVDILIPVHEQALLFSKHLDELRKYVKIELPALRAIFNCLVRSSF